MEPCSIAVPSEVKPSAHLSYEDQLQTLRQNGRPSRRCGVHAGPVAEQVRPLVARRHLVQGMERAEQSMNTESMASSSQEVRVNSELRNHYSARFFWTHRP